MAVGTQMSGSGGRLSMGHFGDSRLSQWLHDGEVICHNDDESIGKDSNNR